uniref:Anaphase-promoting complex subunit 4 WD40 domain-containing protein n=1 Tax=Aureoumbra lagunensis TaxID=44058 RepID=A0A7S3NKS8_9STRA
MATFGGYNEGKYGETKIGYEDKDVACGRHKLVPSMSISGLQAEVFSIRFSPCGKWLAAACGDGAVRVFATTSGALAQTLLTPQFSNGLPCTIARWRPVGNTERTKNVLLTGNAHGALQHWHVTSGKCLNSYIDEENQIYALDYLPSGDRFAAAGKDPIIKIFDEDTRQLVSTLKGGFGFGLKGEHGHSNRIFSLKFDSSDPNILASAGWDNTIQIWDCRQERSVRTIYGPHLCGDSLDISDDNILAGSWKPTEQLQIYSLSTGQLVRTIDWSSSYLSKQEPLMVYAAQYSKPTNSEFLAAGGSGANEARVFDINNKYGLVGTVTGLARGVFTLDFAPNGRRLSVAGGDATIRIIDIVSREEWELERPGNAQ